MDMNFSFMNFLISCFMFSFFYKHILLTLISLEFMMINMFMNLYMILMNLNLNMYFIMMFINIMICEGVIGLSLMVYMIRNSGNDYSNILNLLKW